MMKQLDSHAEPTDSLACRELWWKNSQLQELVNKYMEENNKLNKQIANMEDFINDANKATAEDMKKYLQAIELLDLDFKETSEALDRAHEKIKEDLKVIEELVEKNERTEAQNAELKEKEKILKRKLKLLKDEIKDLDEIAEEGEDNNPGVFFFWTKGNRLEECQKKVIQLHKALQEAYDEKIESQRRVATLNFQLKKSKEFIHNQSKVISQLELQTKKEECDCQTSHGKCTEFENADTDTDTQKKTQNHEAMNSKLISKEYERTKLRLEQKVANLRREKVDLERKINSLRQTMTLENDDELRRANAELHRLREEMESLRMENQQLTSKVSECHEVQQLNVGPETTPAQNEIQLLQIKNEDLQNCYFFKVEENINLNKTINELKQKVNDLISEKEELNHKMREELAKEKVQNEKIQDFTQHNEEVINNLTLENRQLENTIRALQGEKINFGEVFETFSKELLDLQRMLGRYTRDRTETESMDSVSMQEDVDVVSIGDSEYTSTSLSSTGMNRGSSFISEEPPLSVEARETTSKLKVYPTKYGKLQSTNNRKQTTRVASLSGGKSVSELENIQRLQSTIGHLKSQIGKITTSVDVIEFEKDDLELEVNRLKATDMQYYNTNLKLIDENRRLKEELIDVKGRNKGLVEEKRSLVENVTQLERTLNEGQRNFKTQLADCQRQDNEIRDLKQVKANLKTKINETEKADSHNVLQDRKLVNHEVGDARPGRRVAEIVSLLERNTNTCIPIQPSPRDRKTKRANPLTTSSSNRPRVQSIVAAGTNH